MNGGMMPKVLDSRKGLMYIMSMEDVMTRTIDVTKIEVKSAQEWNEYCKQNNLTPTPIPETIQKQIKGVVELDECFIRYTDEFAAHVQGASEWVTNLGMMGDQR